MAAGEREPPLQVQRKSEALPLYILALLLLSALVSLGLVGSLFFSLQTFSTAVSPRVGTPQAQSASPGPRAVALVEEGKTAPAAAAAAAPEEDASGAPPEASPTPCFKADAKAVDCFRGDPSMGRAWRDPGFTNFSALPSYKAGGGMFAGRFVAGPLDLVACYLSRAQPKNKRRREMLRRSFSLLDTAHFRVAYYWLLTPPTDPAALAEVLEENATHGDIAWASPSVPDGELTNKVWQEMGVAFSLKQSPFWVKMDDDAVILWDRFLPVLYKEMPREGLVWCSQGSGQGGLYCTGPYLFSMDVVGRFANDPGACCGGGNLDDWWFPNIGWNNRAIWNFGADRRWHNDDMGQEYICACKPWTLTSDSVVVHKVNPPLLEAWLTNKTRFSLLGQPHHRYGYNVCNPGDKHNPSCNHVPACQGPAPAPTDCIIWPTQEEREQIAQMVDGSRGY